MRTPTSLHSWGVPIAIASGAVALAVRAPSPEAVWVTASVGAIGGITPVAAAVAERGARLRWFRVVLAGILAFAAVAAWSGALPAKGGILVVATASVAAVAEEVFFRRLVFGWLQEWGAAAAIAGSALLFALVHLPVYGPGVLPIDFAAGLVFGWQRWASGTWTAPAVTHVAANLLALVALR